jgi:phosphatidylglycerol:prolipoprotein diacylglycerol transferase
LPGVLTLAEAFSFNPLGWEIVPRIPIGPGISPHGIGIAVGYLVGAQLMVRRARARPGSPDEADIWNALFWALLGAIVGARVGYVLGHIPEVTDNGSDWLGLFRVWEGGISLIGGITGAILFGLPYMVRKRMGVWRSLDLAVPGLALGIVIGRIGDLMIGDHLGKPTDFFLGWKCLGDVTGNEGPVSEAFYRQALERGDPPSLGCFDLTLHQTALYDLFSTLLLLGVLLWLGRKARNLGFLTLIFAIWYGAMRVITDFLRVDRRYFGLTGSQLMTLAVGVAALYLLARYRGAPPWARREGPETPEGPARDIDAGGGPGTGAGVGSGAPDGGTLRAEDVGPGPVRLEDPPDGHPVTASRD